jgi:hypothetical protein
VRKPLHKVAIALWVLAAAIILLWGWSLFDFLSMPAHAGLGQYLFGIAAAAILIALGTIVELIDQIRWNALPPDQRNRS